MPKDRKPLSLKSVKNRKIKIHNHKFETRTILVPLDLVPCGPAFAYDERRKEIVPVTINGYHSELVEVDSGYFCMRLFGYRCNLYCHSESHGTWGFWPSTDIYLTKAEAERQTAFTEVKLADSVYLKALGVNRDGNRIRKDTQENTIDESELQPCCANISEVRDQLIGCMKRKGLEKWRIDLIKDYLQGSHPEFLEGRPDHSVSNLDKILTALGIFKSV